jgi:iron(III) transport system permease protein
MSRGLARIVFLTTAIFFAAFFLWPIIQILKGGFVDADGHFTFAFLTTLLRDPLYQEGLLNAFWIACGTLIATTAIALPLAFIADRFRFPGKGVLTSLILVPIVLPPFVGAIGLKQIFGQYGALNALIISLHLRPPGWTYDWFMQHRMASIIAIEALSLYPILYLNTVAALANIDPAMDEAAQNLGSTAWRRFWRITLPLIRPGLFAGGTIIFIWAFTELGVPLMFDYQRCTPVQIFQGLKDIGANPIPYTLVTLMLAATVVLYAVGKGLFGQAGHAMMAKATSSGGAKALTPASAWACTLAFATVTFFAVLPHLGVILVSFASDWYRTVFPAHFTLNNFQIALGHDITVPAIANSLKFSSLSTLVDVILGLAIAYVIVRTKILGRQVLDFLAMLPLAVPGIVLAFGYLAMSQDGKFFSFINPVNNPTALLVIAYAIRRLPYVVRSAMAGFEQTSVTLEEAAQNLGASPLRALARVTLPLIVANLIAGGLLAFAFAMLEVSDSIFLAQKQVFFPITKAIFELYQLLGDGKFLASALGVWAMAFLAITIVGATVMLGKRLGALFRV